MRHVRCMAPRHRLLAAPLVTKPFVAIPEQCLAQLRVRCLCRALRFTPMVTNPRALHPTFYVGIQCAMGYWVYISQHSG